MVVEVLSPSNTGVAWDRKMREYRRHPKLLYILLVDSEIVAATLYRRTPAGWDDIDADKLADTIELPDIGCSLTMAEIYDGTGLPEGEPLED